MNLREKSLAKRVAHLMKSTRLERGLTQKEVAGKLGVAQGTLSKMENGRLMPSVIQWFDFCNFTGLSSDSILEKGGSGSGSGDANPQVNFSAGNAS